MECPPTLSLRGRAFLRTDNRTGHRSLTAKPISKERAILSGEIVEFGNGQEVKYKADNQ
jgi:hypothetical protein